MTIFKDYLRGQVKVISGSRVWCNIKMANLSPEITFKNLGAQLFVFKKKGWTPQILRVLFLTNGIYEKKTNLAPEITFKKAKLGP